MKKNISIIFKIIAIIGGIIGIYLNLSHSFSSIVYYTIQTNIFCVLFWIIALILTITNKKWKQYPLFRGMTMSAILVTMIVYHLILKPQMFSMGSTYDTTSWNDILAHTFVPLMFVLDYILFDTKGQFKKYYPFIWLSIPVGYYIFTKIYSLLGGKFGGMEGQTSAPYFFLNPEQVGVDGVIKWIIIILIFFLILSYAIILIDKSLAKIIPKKAKH